MINQLFMIPGETYKALSNEETEATYKDMVELGIAQPPYEKLTIALPMWSCFQVISKTGKITDFPKDDLGYSAAYFHYELGQFVRCELPETKDLKPLPDMVKWLQSKPNVNLAYSQVESVTFAGRQILKALIVLLATRNAVKTTIHNKLAKFGVGKQRAEYVTTITLGEIDEAVYEGGEPTGRTLRPHLRRGHIRRQHYGPNLAFVKKVFIQPVFVNADETFVNSRTAYNVSGIKH